ncbi:IS3 family transposase [Streptomyces sp. TLI_171]|uniref:IS3 family transposase n=1 Tax=Streptomyces sp. TLI_171 TaxID=1938859 RepID=UPI000C17F277|nr:IS3 family transposase [Streptomyces sp. TLI_171]
MIRTEAGMPTAGLCRLIGAPERTWRRQQARARQGAPTRGPWPRPARESVRETARRHALAHPAWGHRKVWAMCRHDGHRVSQTTVLRLLRDEGLLLKANHQRERRQLAARR